MKDEALRLALEALNDRASLTKWQKAREAIKQALEQPEPAIDAQKIVDGFFDYHKQRETQSTHSADCYKWHHQCAIAEVDRLRSQPEPEAVAWIVDEGEVQLSWNQPAYSKATPLYTSPPKREPEPEPVGRFAKFSSGVWKEVTDGSAGQPLYTSPLKRKPLTDLQISLEAHNIDPDDWDNLRYKECWHKGFAEGVRFAEAAHGIGEKK